MLRTVEPTCRGICGMLRHFGMLCDHSVKDYATACFTVNFDLAAQAHGYGKSWYPSMHLIVPRCGDEQIGCRAEGQAGDGVIWRAGYLHIFVGIMIDSSGKAGAKSRHDSGNDTAIASSTSRCIYLMQRATSVESAVIGGGKQPGNTL